MKMLQMGAAALLAIMMTGGVALADDSDAVMLLYQKHEPGIAPYPSRVIVTDQFIRFDDGVDQGNFALYDRKREMVFNVVHEDRTVLEIPRMPVEAKPPVPLKLSEQHVELQDDTPRVAGREPQQHALYSGVKRCYSVVAVPGLLPDVAEALSEFRQLMAGEHAFALEYIPAEQRDPCDMAVHIFRPGWFLQFGLPIQHWDEMGNAEALIDYKVGFEVAPGLFELPSGYRHYSIRDL